MKKTIALLLCIFMILPSFSACGGDGGSPTSSPEPTLDAEALEKMTSAEILCAYFREIAKANPDAGTEKLANLLSLHECFDNMALNIYTQEWGNPDNPVYLQNFPEDFTLTQCVRVCMLSFLPTMQSSTATMDFQFAGYLFELKEGEDAGQFCELLKRSVVFPQLDKSRAATDAELELETAVDGNRVFFVLCNKSLKTALGSNPNRKDTAKYILKKLQVDAELNIPVQSIYTNDENSVYFTGVTSTDLLEKDAALAEPMVGFGFSVVLVKVKNVKDVETVVREMENGLDPGKWICVRAENVEVVSCGQYVLGIMSSKEDCARISAAFLEMLSGKAG